MLKKITPLNAFLIYILQTDGYMTIFESLNAT